jgi:hypothetical protein
MLRESRMRPPPPRREMGGDFQYILDLWRNNKFLHLVVLAELFE